MSLFLWLTIAVVVAVTGFLFGRIRRKKNKITPVANDFDLESNDNDHNNENESDDCVLGPSRVISSVNSNNSIKQPNQQKIEPGIEKSAHHKWEDSNIEQNDSEPKFTSSLTGSLTDSHENESLNDIPLYELGHVVQCYVMAPDEETFQGASLLQNLLALGCRFGEMSIFHRFEPASQKSKLFSVASALEPGVFKLETMEGLNTPGLILFFTLPGPDRPLVAYDQMIHTARRLTERLGGVLLNEYHEPLTHDVIQQVRRALKVYQTESISGSNNGKSSFSPGSESVRSGPLINES